MSKSLSLQTCELDTVFLQHCRADGQLCAECFFIYLFLEVLKCIRLFLGESQQVDAELWPQAVSSAIPCIIEMMDDVMVASDKKAGMPRSMGKIASLFTRRYLLTK